MNRLKVSLSAFLILSLSIGIGTAAGQYTNVSFYIAAHEDDFQLFCGEQTYNDIQNSISNKVVIIHTTAGDAGDINDGYWEAREQGEIASIRAAVPSHPVIININKFNGHPVLSYTCGNTVNYFMRLPDGNPNGTGNPDTNYQSLSKLRDSNKPITAVDGSTTYNKWTDFCNTLSAIVQAEKQGISQAHPFIHAADYSSSTNPLDHADHKATSDAVRSFAYKNGFNRSWFLTYYTYFYPGNLYGIDLVNKKKLFDAYCSEVLRVTTLNGGPVQTNQDQWTDWGNRSYSRQVAWNIRDTDNPSPVSGISYEKIRLTMSDPNFQFPHDLPP